MHIRVVIIVHHVISGLLSVLIVAVSQLRVLELLDKVMVAVAAAALARLAVGSRSLVIHFLVRNRGDVVASGHVSGVVVASTGPHSGQSRFAQQQEGNAQLRSRQQRRRSKDQTTSKRSGAVLCKVTIW